jgi:hypothetical protein
MWQSFRELDRILRGEATRPSAVRWGMIDLPVGRLSGVIVLLGLLYGLCMGCYALFKAGGADALQLLATTLKVPLLFCLTVIVTFPSLYVFNALVGSRLTLAAVLRLLVAALGVMLAVLASFGPIVAFFAASTTSHPFMLLLNVLIFAVAGFLGLKFLLLTLHRLSVAVEEALAQPPSAADLEVETLAVPAAAPGGRAKLAGWLVPPAAGEPAGPLEHLEGRVLGPHVTTVFRTWVILFGLVGAQMAWVLRPFLGHPDLPFRLFCPRESNFFEAVGHAVLRLFS